MSWVADRLLVERGGVLWVVTRKGRRIPLDPEWARTAVELVERARQEQGVEPVVLDLSVLGLGGSGVFYAPRGGPDS